MAAKTAKLDGQTFGMATSIDSGSSHTHRLAMSASPMATGNR